MLRLPVLGASLRIFISFASKDRETVRRFEAALRGRRPEMSCFLDERGLTGGVYWIPKLGEELGKADVVLLLLGTSIGPWQELEYYEALQLSHQSGRGGRPRIIPVVIADRSAPGLAFLSTLHQIFALDLTSAPVLLAIENALSAIPATEVVEPWRRFQPYTGLPALTQQDAAFFFGRDKETAEVLDLLARARGRIVTLIGQSGVGKSSLVMAGVLSRLKSQLWPIEGAAWPAALKDSRSYQQLTMRPGLDPIKELAVGLVKLYRTQDESDDVEREANGWTARFREGSRLRDMLRLTRDRIAEQQGGYPPKRFVLYVDQGEELYTRAPKDEARLFSRLLADAAGELETFSVLLSLRSDFYTDLQNDAAIFDLSEKFDVLPLRRDVLIDVIRKPAEVLGARFEDPNLPRLMADATERAAGALPLLSDLLQEMWLNMLSRGDGVLRWSDQPGIVDISLPLKRRADAFLELPTTDRDVVRRLFTLRLTQIAQVGEPVRRRARKSECTTAEWSVAAQLAGPDQRLLTISNPHLGGEPIVEVAHEQLLQSWPTLKGWLQEEREFLIWRTETEQAATDYGKLPVEKRPEAVLMGLRLSTAESWFAQRADDLAPELRDYVKASIDRRDELLDRQKREDAQKLETEQRLKETELERERLARTAAEEKASAALKLFRFSFAAAIVMVFLTGSSIVGFLSARRATQAAVANKSRALSALSRTAIDKGLGTDAAELALSAWPRNTADSRPELEVALQMLGASTAFRLEVVPRMAHDGSVSGALFSRDESRILSWSYDKTLRLWDAATGAPIGPAMRHDGSVSGALFSRDESRILSWSYDKTLRLWDAATGAPIGPAMRHDGSVSGARFSRDESLILSWSDDGTLRLWDAATGAPIGPAMRHDGSVFGARFSRDQSRILSWSNDGTLRLWDAATGAPIGPAMKHDDPDDPVIGALFSRDESRILSWSSDGTLRLWNAATGAPIGPAMRHYGSVFGALFSRDESRILSWSSDKTLRLWDAATGTSIGPTMRHDDSVSGALFSRDESRILSWSYDKTLRLWEAATGAPIGPAMKHDGLVSGARFSRDESRILSWSYDKTLRLWDAATGAPIGPAMKHDGLVSGARFSRDERRILSWSDDRTLRLWDAATGAPIGPAMRHDRSVSGARFSRDESRILSWSHDNTLRLWDAATGAPIGPAMRHDGSVSGARFSRDESRILSWSSDGTLRLWDAATGAPIGPAMRHDGSGSRRAVQPGRKPHPVVVG